MLFRCGKLMAFIFSPFSLICGPPCCSFTDYNLCGYYMVLHEDNFHLITELGEGLVPVLGSMSGGCTPNIVFFMQGKISCVNMFCNFITYLDLSHQKSC